MRLGDGGAAAGGEGDARRHAAGEWLEGAAFREADGAEGSSASSPLSPALFSYEGIQYQNIAPRVLSADALEYLQRRLRILSGLYGVLRPFDGVAPYRLEMQAKLSVGGARDLYGYWGDALAESLAAELSDQLAADPCESPVLVNLASVEYAKAAVPHAQAAGVRVLTCLFGTVREGRLVQRPTEAKAARGTFARWCAEHAVESEADLARFDVGGYALDEALCAPGTFVFTKR